MVSLFIDRSLARELMDILTLKINTSASAYADKAKSNCWEYMKCGRSCADCRPGMDICPTATEWRLHGIHGGENAGRACWVITGTLCNNTVQSTFEEKNEECKKCPFYRKVKVEEDGYLLSTENLLEIIEEHPSI
jgi:hypothetical protein